MNALRDLHRIAGMLVVLLALAWFALPSSPAVAQDESGQWIEFPFRNPQGQIVWFARAQRGQHRYGVRHPLKPNVVTHAQVFERDPDLPSRDAQRFAGVRVVLPVRSRSGVGAGADTARVIILEAEQARFFQEYELLEFTDVRMELRYSERSVRRDTDSSGGPQPGEPGSADQPISRSGGAGPEVVTRRLYIRWDTATGPDGKSGKYATIFTDERFTLDAPEQDVVIRHGTGLLTKEAEGFSSVQILRDVDGTFMRLPLAIGSSDTSPTWEGTRFGCDGECTIAFDRGMAGQVKQISMRRGVVLSQGSGRELHCRELDVALAPGATAEDPPRISRLLARGQVDLTVPGNFRARVGLLVMTWDEDADGSDFVAVMRHVLRLQLWANDNVNSGTTSLTATDSERGGDRKDDARTTVRTRVDGLARDRVVLRSQRLKRPPPGQPAGTEQWEFVGQARMERWTRTAEPDLTPDGDAADFGVRLPREAMSDDLLRRQEPPPVVGNRPTAEGWTLSAVLNGAGVEGFNYDRRDPQADDDPANPDDPDALLALPAIDPREPVPGGTIVLRFALSAVDRSPTRNSRRAEATRSLEALYAYNPGNGPVLELLVDDVRSSLRFFATHFEVTQLESPDPRYEMEQTRFSGDSPQVIWLTPRDFNPLQVLAPERAAADPGLRPTRGESGTVFRYSARSSSEIVMQQRFPSNGPRRIERLDLQMAGHSRLQKTVWTGGSTIDSDRLELLCDCDDLRLGFSSAFDRQLEMVEVDAKPRTTDANDPPGTGGTVQLHVGPDRCTCRGLTYRRAPDPGANPSATTNADGEVVPARWSSVLRMEGPVEFTLRDPITCGLVPLADPDGGTVVAAWVRATGAGRTVMRAALRRTPTDPMATESRTLEVVGPCELLALADDPADLRAEQLPRQILKLTGDYLHARIVADQVDDMPFERLEHLSLAGHANLQYGLQGLTCSAQRVDYRHDPTATDPLPRLVLAGSPMVQYMLNSAEIRGTGEIVFPPTVSPVELASRRIELIGEPDRISIRPRCGLRFTPHDTDLPAVLLMADSLDVGLWRDDAPAGKAAAAEGKPHPARVIPPVDQPDRNSMAERARRSRLGMLASGGGPLRFRELTAVGNVVVTRSNQQASGDKFHWTDDLRGQRIGTLTGHDPRFSSRAGAGDKVALDLFHLDATRVSGATGSSWQFMETDPDHPERRNIITADAHERQQMRLRFRR